MKRNILSLLLALVLVVLCPISALGEVAEKPIAMALYTFGVDPAQKALHLTLQLQNQTETPLSLRVYTVVENEDGTADSCQTHQATAKGGDNLVSFVHTYQQAGQGKTLKIYCWNGSMQPLAVPIQKSLSFDATVTALSVETPPIVYLSDQKPKTLNIKHTPSSLPAPTYRYASNDASILKVSANGELTGVSAGNAAITVMTADRSAYTTCKILVVSAPTALKLNASTLSVEEQEDFRLTPTITPADAPNKQVIYTSKDPSIAKVSAKGVVTGVKVGKTTVTAKMGDGSATATCTVTVTPAVLGVTLNQHSINMWDYGMYTLTAKVKGGDGQKVVWKSSDDLIATVSDSGIVFGVGKGSAVITATAGSVTASCKVKVYREYDYTGSIAAHFESRDNPASISGSGTGKSYGCFQLYAGSNGPKAFYNWLISTGFSGDIGNTLKAAHQKDGGKDNTFGTNFDKAWKSIAASQKEEFRSCQMAYCMSKYYEPLVNRLVSEQNFYPDNYSLALKSALWSRAIQHGVGGAYNRIVQAFEDLKGFEGKSEKQIITAIYKECGKVVSTPPSDTSIPMNKDSSIAVEYGLVGKYMKYYSSSSSSMQAGVWKRLNVTEPQMLFDLMENPPVIITPQK